MSFSRRHLQLLLALSPLLLIILTTVTGFAAEHGGGEGHGHGEAKLDEETVRTIMYQAINVGVIVVGLVYYLRKPVREFFAQKHKTFVAAAEKAMTAQKKAEEEYAQIKIQLAKLETTTQESVARAKAEAADLRNSLVAEAHSLSKRIHEEGQTTAILEIEKAKRALRQEMINEATKLAQTQIQSAVSSEDHVRLNKEFIQNIEAQS